MAKSEGNIFLLGEALDAYGRDALILYYCGGHYRQPVEFDAERLDQATASARRIREAARRLTRGPSPAWSAPLQSEFFAALAEDFNTPRALAAAFEWIAQANSAAGPVGDADLREMLDVLGLANLLDLDLLEPPARVRELLEQRERARSDRDFANADALREEIRELGWELRDSPQGPELLPRQ